MKTFAYGKLGADSDSWLLETGHVILLDVTLIKDFDGSLDGKPVSVIGTMGIPPVAPGKVKLIVEELASHDDIAIRAFEISKSGEGGSQDDHWFRAERELLGI